MTTPNIEELMALADRYATLRIGEGTANARKELHDAMQSQAERIKELEAEIITRASYGDEQTDFAIKLAGERDALRAQLAEIEKREPVAWAISYDGVTPYTLWCEGDGALLDCEVKRQGGTTRKMPLFTRPMPPIVGLQDVHDAVTADPTLADCAQNVMELVEALEKLARLGNGEHYGNSDGNMIARSALAKYKGAK